MKRFLPVFILFSTLIFTVNVFALELTKIGILDTSGSEYAEWWYSGINPTLYGTSDQDTVTITFGDDTYTADVSDSNWQVYIPAESADYSVNISDSSDSYAFTLHLGQNMGDSDVAESTTSGTTVPTTGSDQLVAIAFSMGILLLASYMYFWGANKTQFEKYFFE